MSGLKLCMGMVAKPYYVEEMDINLYSIEEMAYYLYNNVYIVNRDFFNEKLTTYLREEYNMPELADRIEKAIKYGDSYAELVMILVSASGYYDRDELLELQYILERIGDKSVDERMLLKAEMFVKKGKYSKAYDIYKKIIKRNSRCADKKIMPQLWKSMGIIYIRRFDYKGAAVCFEKSLGFENNEDTVEKLIMAYMLCDRTECASRAAQKYNVSDENYERIRIRIKECRQEIKSGEKYKELAGKVRYDGRTNLEEFYSGVSEIINKWKEEYREEMA